MGLPIYLSLVIYKEPASINYSIQILILFINSSQSGYPTWKHEGKTIRLPSWKHEGLQENEYEHEGF